MLLALCLLLSDPAVAGRRAEEAAAAAARIATLEAEVARLSATVDALAEENRAQDLTIYELRLRADAEESAREEDLAAIETRLATTEHALTTPAGKKAKVDPRVVELEAKVAALSAELQALKPLPSPPSPPRPSQADEDAATELLSQVTEAVDALDFVKAKALAEQLTARFPDTRAGKSARRTSNELAVLGTKVTEPTVERWYTAPAQLAGKSLTLVVFWETWCPHCKREVPELNPWVTRYEARGFQVIALTKVTKSSTDEAVEAFIADNQLNFAVGKETGTESTTYAVSGIPAAALVKDGVVVWRGHPARLTDALIERFLAKPD